MIDVPSPLSTGVPPFPADTTVIDSASPSTSESFARRDADVITVGVSSAVAAAVSSTATGAVLGGMNSLVNVHSTTFPGFGLKTGLPIEKPFIVQATLTKFQESEMTSDIE